MTRPRPNDVRKKQMGAIIGDGSDVLLDTERAVLLRGVEVCLVNTVRRVVDGTQRGEPASEVALALRLDGRVNKTQDPASILFILDADGAAAIVTELVALASRIGPEFATLFQERMETLSAEGHMGDGAQT